MINLYFFCSEIQQSEKITLKTALISNFDEPVPQIAVQIAALIAKIARYNQFTKPYDRFDTIRKLSLGLTVQKIGLK